MSKLIVAQNLVRKFKMGSTTVFAVNDVSLEIEKGKLTLLRGKSGSGKTTLLNILGLIDRADAGRLFFNQKELTKLTDRQLAEIRRTQIGFIFQSIALISFLTALENVEFALRVAGYPKAELKPQAVEALKLVGLEKRLNHLAYELSGGEQQRVAIARALAHRPKVILADEPTAELDSKRALQVIKLFHDLCETYGVTIVITSHDPNITELTDFVYELKDGKLISAEALIKT